MIFLPKKFPHVNPRESLPPAGDYPCGRYAGCGVQDLADGGRKAGLRCRAAGIRREPGAGAGGQGRRPPGRYPVAPPRASTAQ